MDDNKQPATEPEAGSPVKLLLWFLIPLVLIILYGVFGHS